MRFGNAERGLEYSLTSKGCDDEGMAFCFCVEGASGADESCAHAAGTIMAAKDNAAARRSARKIAELESERCISHHLHKIVSERNGIVIHALVVT
jgi:hypothetical protein